MKRLTLMFALAAGLFAAGLPKDAEKVSETLYRHTAPGGKVTLYRQSPFGWMQYDPASAKGAETPASESAAISVEERGAEWRFTRPGPFGAYSWTRSKSATLTAGEQAAVDAARARPDSN